MQSSLTEISPIEAKLLSRRLITDTGCWEWTGSKFVGREYGQVKHEGKNWRVHRLAYTLWVEPIPDGFTIDHVCRNGGCFNPDHLEAVTIRANTLRGIGPSAVNARRKKCVKGHPLSGDNLYINPMGRRKCRACLRDSGRRHDLKRGWDKGDREKARTGGRERSRRYRERKQAERLAEKIDMMLAR